MKYLPLESQSRDVTLLTNTHCLVDMYYDITLRNTHLGITRAGG